MTYRTIHHARQVRMMPGICRCLHPSSDWDKIAETSTSLEKIVYMCSTAGLIRYCAASHSSACTLSSFVSSRLNSLTYSLLKHFMHYSQGAMSTNACIKLL